MTGEDRAAVAGGSGFSHFSISSLCSVLTGWSDLITNVDTVMHSPILQYTSHGKKKKKVMHFFLSTKPFFFFFPPTFSNISLSNKNCSISFEWLGKCNFLGGGRSQLCGQGEGKDNKALILPSPLPQQREEAEEW